VRWQNDASGEFLDVPGATDTVFQFVADEGNTGCHWRILVALADPVESGEAAEAGASTESGESGDTSQ
jgi:hypothetical protein